MSGSAKNIQRDGYWVNPKTSSDIGWSNDTALTSTAPVANLLTTKQTAKACVQSNATAVTQAIDTQKIIGVLMQEPIADNTPYRIQAGACVVGQSHTIDNFAIVIGYAPASPTGTNDTIEDPFYIPFRHSFDGMVIVPHLESGDTYFGRALFVGIAHQAGLAISPTALHIKASLSVQRLGTTPPTMNFAVP